MPRPKKTNRKDNQYEIKREIGKDLNGKTVRRSFYGKSKWEAEDKYRRFMEEKKKREEEKKRMLFCAWAEKWLYAYKEPDVKQTTFVSTYERPCKNHILPYFRDAIIQEISQLDVKTFLNSISEKSQSYLDKVLICLNGIFESAIDNDLITKNPCRNVSVRSKASKEKKRTYDQATADALCSSDHKYAIYVHILLRMGLRCSELCGLRWSDIDLDRGVMHVRQSLTSEGSRIFISAPKSSTSVRRLEIPEDLHERLAEAYSNEDRTEYVATFNGHHITPNHFGDRQLEAFYNALGVPRDKRLSAHELRHTCGTLLYERTKDIFFVSKFLGHSDISITSKIYVHSEMQEDQIHVDF